MFSLPRYAYLTTMLGILCLVLALAVTPVASHDSPPGAGARFWWARLAYSSYAAFILDHPRVVRAEIGDSTAPCPQLESEQRAWQYFARRDSAAVVFARLTHHADRRARIMGAAGLAHLGIRPSRSLLDSFRRDSGLFYVEVWNGRRFEPRNYTFESLALPEGAQWMALALASGMERCAV